MDQALAVSMRGIDKAFYGVKANDAVDFDLRRGEVHALLGENGAGKSTLCSVLAGLYLPDAGEIRVNGERGDLRSPKDAFDAGIGMVYQHFRVVDNLTVAENLALGHPDLGAIISQKELEATAREIGDRYGLPVEPSARIWQLSVGEQQRVEILKMLHREASILILDEPTAVLTPQETDALFATVRRMADEGRSIILVSHKLNEIMQVADRVTVMRDGKRVGETVSTDDVTPRELARLMVGREFDLPTREAGTDPGEVVLSVRDLRVMGERGLEAVKGLTFDVRAGEVLGVAGVSGNGQRELAFGLVGLRPAASGFILLHGKDITRSAVLERIRKGLAFVPQQRLGMGLASGLTTSDNMAIKTFRLPPFMRRRVLSKPAFRTYAEDLVARYDVRGVRPGLPISLLSGGNLQKALIAREVTQDHDVIIARSPTRGLDVGATEAVRNLILEERNRGVAVLLITEDLDELMALSDRILVLFEGSIAGEMAAEEADVEHIGLLMGGHVEGGSE